jgi:hypothetical protein
LLNVSNGLGKIIFWRALRASPNGIKRGETFGRHTNSHAHRHAFGSAESQPLRDQARLMLTISAT